MTRHRRAEHYVEFVKALVTAALAPLRSEATEDIETCVAGVRSEKAKAARAKAARAKARAEKEEARARSAKGKSLNLGGKDELAAGLDEYLYQRMCEKGRAYVLST